MLSKNYYSVLVLPLFLRSMCSDQIETPTSDVFKFVEKLIEFNEEANNTNVLDLFEKLTNNSREFLGLGKSVGALIFKGLKEDFDPLSEEQKAIDLLHQEIEKQFKSMELIEQTSRRSSSDNYDPIGLEYMTEVDLKLTTLERTFGYATMPKYSTRNAFKSYIERSCTDYMLGNNKPVEILSYLDKIYHIDCPFPTKDQIKIYLKTQAAFHLVESRLKEKIPKYVFYHYKVAKNQLLARITLIDPNKADEILKSIEKIKAEYPAQLEKAFLALKTDNIVLNYEKVCMLDIVNNVGDHVRSNLFATIQELTMDLLKTELMIIFCSNIYAKENETDVEKLTEETIEKVENIGKHVIEWIRKVQDLSFPEVGSEAAKRKIDSSHFIPLFNETAAIIREEFEKRGNERFSYQVLVTESKKMNEYWAVKLVDSKNYANLTNFKNIDIHVFKHEKMEEEKRMGKASKWLEEKKDVLLEGIRRSMHATRPNSVLVYLQQQIECPIVSKEFYGSMVLLRNKAFWSRNALINFGEVGWEMASNQNVTNSLMFFENGLFAFAWNLYFYL